MKELKKMYHSILKDPFPREIHITVGDQNLYIRKKHGLLTKKKRDLDTEKILTSQRHYMNYIRVVWNLEAYDSDCPLKNIISYPPLQKRICSKQENIQGRLISQT